MGELSAGWPWDPGSSVGAFDRDSSSAGLWVFVLSEKSLFSE